MRSPAWRLRAAALLSGGVFAAHQLRYLLAYGHESHQALRAQGHGYLALLLPAVVIALTLCAASLVTALVLGDRSPTECQRPNWRRLWASSSGLLLLAYVVQECLEAALEPGHTVGLAVVAGHGGWIVLPLVIVIGLAITLLLVGAATAVARVAARARNVLPRRTLVVCRLPHVAPALPLESFARFLVGRGPPVVSR